MESTLVVVILGIGWFVLAIWLLFVTINISKINRRGKVIAKAGKSGDFVRSVENSLKELSLMHRSLEETKAGVAKIAVTLEGAVQRVGVVRFDAFNDVGGRLSFAVALLNVYGDGVVISTINGRQESRSYAKPVKNGESEFNLSTEERQAISEALSNKTISAGSMV